MASIFIQLARKVLEAERRPLAIKEIWEVAEKKGFDKEISTTGKTPWFTLSALLHGDVRNNPQSLFLAIGSRPKKFMLKSLVESNGEEILSTHHPKR